MTKIRILIFAIVALVLMISVQTSVADLPIWSDTYQSPNYYAGFGLHGHLIDADLKIDLVTTSWNFYYPEGGHTWFKDDDNLFSIGQNISGGLEAKFGNLMNRLPWYLAVAGVDLVLYEVASNQLNQIQSFNGVSQDYLSWGYINGDNYMDLVTSGGETEENVNIYMADNLNERLSAPTYFNTSTCCPGKLALVRMEEFWGDDKRWDLVTVDAATRLRIYPNNNQNSFTSVGATTIHPSGIPGTHTIIDMAIGDIDHNEFDDIVICANQIVSGTGKIFTYLNSGLGYFYTNENQIFTVPGGVEQVALGEFDYNGYPDLAVLTADGDEVLIYKNCADETGHFDFTAPSWTGQLTNVTEYGGGYE